MNKAVTELHQSPWQTSYLHYPYGVPLAGHTLNPFNGFIGIVLLKFLTLVETYNFIVIFSFVIAGLTAFWLSYYFTNSYWGSMIAGCIFTFSNYHFAHADGHLNLVSLEWVPLFVLCWYIFIMRPGLFLAIGSGLLLFLVFLCDYYYFFYCILTGCMAAIQGAIQKKDMFFFLKRKYIIPFAIFILAVIATAGPLTASLMRLNIRDPFWGSHPSSVCSLDILAPFIYGGHWRFARLTEFYWSKLPGSIAESSVHMGISVVFVLIYMWVRRRKFLVRGAGLWYFMVIFFLVMSLGPVLHIWGRKMYFIRLPYGMLKMAFPALKLPGIHVRIAAMIIFMGISIFLVRYIWVSRQRTQTKRQWQWYLALIFLAMVNLDAVLHVWGRGVLFIKLPYWLLEKVFPFLGLTGAPVRMMAMVMLGASVICAMGFKTLFQKQGGKILAAILLSVLIFEYLPGPMPASRIDIPGYIKVLKSAPQGYGIIDTVTWPSLAAYYQTVHEKPIAFSDISRIPKSVLEKDNELRQLVRERELGRLYQDYNIRYLVTDADAEILNNDLSIKMIYNDGKVRLYDLSQ